MDGMKKNIFSFRMVVVGEGREKFGHVFLTDTGTSNGDVTGQSRPVNSVDFKACIVENVFCVLTFSFSL